MILPTTQPLDFSKVNQCREILCLYINRTNYIQSFKLISDSGLKIERLIFPGEQYLFDAFAADEIEVYTNYHPQGVSIMRTPCLSLRVG